jgi:ribosome maturation factor RimP
VAKAGAPSGGSAAPDAGLDAAVTALVGPLAAARGLDVEEVSASPAGRHRRVRVLLDKDGGVSLDECTEVSRALSAVLDEADLLGDRPYTLEVSSPGVTRPLTLPRHWRRAVGRLVRVRGTDGAEITGRVLGADDVAATLDLDGAEHRVPYNTVSRATVQVELRRER